MADLSRAPGPVPCTVTDRDVILDEVRLGASEQDIIDLVGSGDGAASSIDVLYGDTLIEQLPPRLIDLAGCRRAA